MGPLHGPGCRKAQPGPSHRPPPLRISAVLPCGHGTGRLQLRRFQPSQRTDTARRCGAAGSRSRCRSRSVAMRAVLSLCVGAGLAALLAAWRRRRSVREVLFFPSPPCCTEELLAEAEAESCDGRPAPCPCPLPRSDCAFTRLLRRLLSARRSLELCLFAFSSPELGRAVSVLHRRGVRIRVVTDSQYMALRGSQIGVLRLLGIQVRHNQDVAFMHHKFAIVDKKMLITGSLNWTMEAIHSNRENVVIVEDAEIVRPYLDEFERIWEEYDPGNYTFFPKEND